MTAHFLLHYLPYTLLVAGVQHLEVTPDPMYTVGVKNHHANWSANPMGTAPGGPQTVNRVLTRTQHTHKTAESLFWPHYFVHGSWLKSYTHCNPPKSSAHPPSCNFFFCQPMMRICVMRLNFRLSYPAMSLENGHDRGRWVGVHLGANSMAMWAWPWKALG